MGPRNWKPIPERGCTSEQDTACSLGPPSATEPRVKTRRHLGATLSISRELHEGQPMEGTLRRCGDPHDDPEALFAGSTRRHRRSPPEATAKCPGATGPARDA